MTTPEELAKITASQIIREVRKLARENPDKVYIAPKANYDGSRCVYFSNNGHPSCIFGHALYRLGMKSTHFRLANCNTMGIEGLARIWGFKASLRQIDWMRHVQVQQDTKLSWGDAVKKSNSRYPGVK